MLPCFLVVVGVCKGQCHWKKKYPQRTMEKGIPPTWKDNGGSPSWVWGRGAQRVAGSKKNGSLLLRLRRQNPECEGPWHHKEPTNPGAAQWWGLGQQRSCCDHKAWKIQGSSPAQGVEEAFWVFVQLEVEKSPVQRGRSLVLSNPIQLNSQ